MATKKKRKAKRKKESAFDLITDTRQREAARILGMVGYQKGQGRRTGALLNAARKAGVTVQTVMNWAEDPAFNAAIQEVTAELTQTYFEDIKAASAKGNVAGSIYALKMLDPIFDDQLQRELAVLKAKNEQLTALLKEHPIPAIQWAASTDLPPVPPELEPFMH